MRTPATPCLRLSRCHAADGALRTVVAPARTDILAPFDLPEYELRTIPASDGHPLQARILKARGFDATARYPVILRVYGGTGVPLVKDDWDRAALFDQLLAQRGYVVASIDNRTATAASKTIENLSLNYEWGASALNDLLDGVRWLKAQPWVDPARVGVWGRSGGGYFTARRDDAVFGVQGRRLGRARHGLAVLRQQVDRGLHEDARREPGRLRGHATSSPARRTSTGACSSSGARTTTTSTLRTASPSPTP